MTRHLSRSDERKGRREARRALFRGKQAATGSTEDGDRPVAVPKLGWRRHVLIHHHPGPRAELVEARGHNGAIQPPFDKLRTVSSLLNLD
jgi:hypothetical protein